jgi:hypothetical protein
VGDRGYEGRVADRKEGTGSEAKLICSPSVVTPHLRCVFHQCTGGFFFLLRSDRIRVHLPMVAQDLADAAALGTSTITTATVVDVKG